MDKKFNISTSDDSDLEYVGKPSRGSAKSERKKFSRVTVVGDSGAGKTTLASQASDTGTPVFSCNVLQVFYKVLEKKAEEEFRVRLMIQDMNAEQSVRQYVRTFYRNSAAVMIVFNMTKKVTFLNALQWYEEVKLEVIPRSPLILLIGNHAEAHHKQVSSLEAMAFAKKYGMTYMETRTDKENDIEQVFEYVSNALRERVKSGEILERYGWKGYTIHSDIERPNRRRTSWMHRVKHLWKNGKKALIFYWSRYSYAVPRYKKLGLILEYVEQTVL